MTHTDLGTLSGPVLLFGGPYSNLPALRAMRAEATRRAIPPHQVICTGDVVAYCGQPAETLSEIRDWGCQVVAGNCEVQLAEDAEDCGCGFDEGSVCDALSGEWYAFARTRIDAEARAWMAALPHIVTFTHRTKRYAVIHGGAGDLSRFLWPGDDKSSEIKALGAEVGPIDRVIAGHCGLAFVEPSWLNAGVIGMPPHDGQPQTRFAILEGAPELHRLSYDVSSAQAAMAGRASPYSASLSSGWWPSEDVLPPHLRRPHPN